MHYAKVLDMLAERLWRAKHNGPALLCHYVLAELLRPTTLQELCKELLTKTLRGKFRPLRQRSRELPIQFAGDSFTPNGRAVWRG